MVEGVQDGRAGATGLDFEVASKVVEFIFSASGRYAIVCNLEGTIIAAKVASRIGTVHAGARRMLQEGLPQILISVAEEEASGGVMKAGCNLPLLHNGDVIGSVGIAGDPERTEPVTRMAAGLFSKELREGEMLRLLMTHAATMNKSITEIVATVERIDASQAQVAAKVDQVETLVDASFDDLQKTNEVITTIQAIASNTQMLGLNASIEAAHAGQHGRGFAIVAEAVRKLSVQCAESAESIKETQFHLQQSMSLVVDFSKDLAGNAHAQTKAISAIAGMVAELKAVSEGLLAMTR
jgi:hypothetical protein